MRRCLLTTSGVGGNAVNTNHHERGTLGLGLLRNHMTSTQASVGTSTKGEAVGSQTAAERTASHMVWASTLERSFSRALNVRRDWQSKPAAREGARGGHAMREAGQ